MLIYEIGRSDLKSCGSQSRALIRNEDGVTKALPPPTE